jgi:hypothetical protein
MTTSESTATVRVEIHQNGDKLLTLQFDSSFLPRLTMFRSGTAQATLTALYSNLVGETNSNISPWTKHWLRWHYKLGHLEFEYVRRLGVAGWLFRHQGFKSHQI